MKKKIKALSFGAVLWDIIGDCEYIGGAPFNVAVNMHRLGAQSAFISSVGKDERGNRALSQLRQLGVSDQFVQISEKPTGAAYAKISESGDATYEIPHAAFDDISISDDDIQKIKDFDADVICFGSFEQRCEVSRNSIQKILSAVSVRHVFFDVNLRMNFIDRDVLDFGFRKSSIVKVNDEEKTIISKMLYSSDLSEDSFAERFVADYGVECLIITLGGRGCFVYANGKAFRHCPPPVQTVDTIGAGDAFSSAFLYSYLIGEGSEVAARKGNALGSYVASRSGALPEIDSELLFALTKTE